MKIRIDPNPPSPYPVLGARDVDLNSDSACVPFTLGKDISFLCSRNHTPHEMRGLLQRDIPRLVICPTRVNHTFISASPVSRWFHP